MPPGENEAHIICAWPGRSFSWYCIGLTANVVLPPRGVLYCQKATEPSVLVVTRYLRSPRGDGQKLTDVIMPVWPESTAMGPADCRSQTRRIRSSEPAASSVLSRLTAMSVISADAPRNVVSRRPSIALQSLTSRSSAPLIKNGYIIVHYLNDKICLTYSNYIFSRAIKQYAINGRQMAKCPSQKFDLSVKSGWNCLPPYDGTRTLATDKYLNCRTKSAIIIQNIWSEITHL